LNEKKDFLIKDSFILFLATSIVNISNFIFHMYVTRHLSPTAYGALATLLAIIIIVAMPAQALQMTIAKKAAIYKAHNNLKNIGFLFYKTTKWFFILGIFYFAFFMLFSGIIKNFFKIDDFALILILALISIIALLLPVIRGILQGLQKFIGFGLNLIVDALFRLIFVLLLVSIGFGLRGALASSFLSATTAYIIGLFMIKELCGIDNYKGEVLITKKEIFKYAFPVFLSMFAFSILSYMDLLIVKHFFDKEQAGLYAVTSIIGKAFLYFPMAIAMALFPKVSENFELNKSTRTMLMKSMVLTFAISIFGFLFCYFFPNFVIKLLTGGGKYYGIADIVKIFGIAILPLVLMNVLINYLLAIHRYLFIYIMYAGIILYGILLWFFHSSFHQIIFILFISNLLILLFSVISVFIKFNKKVKV